MTLYQGTRNDNQCLLTADSVALTPPANNNPEANQDNGFEWGYAGRGPDRLALVILTHHFGSIGLALNHQKNFVDNVIAELPFDGWTMTSEDIENAISGIVKVNLTLTELMSKVRGNPTPYQA